MLGEVVRTRRKALGWKQQTLAAKTGLAQSYISMIESGRVTDVRFATLRQLSQALELALEVLLRAVAEDGTPIVREVPGTEDLPGPIRRMVQLLADDFDAADWEAVAEYAEARAALRARRRAAKLGDSVGYHVPAAEQEEDDSQSARGADDADPPANQLG